MANRCTVCQSPRRREIDKTLLAGQGRRTIAHRFKVGEFAVQRHRIKCVSTALERAEEEQTWTIAGQMRSLCFRAAATLEKAEKSGKVRDVTLASREARETLMALAKLTGELDESARVNVLIQQRVGAEQRTTDDAREAQRQGTVAVERAGRQGAGRRGWGDRSLGDHYKSTTGRRFANRLGHLGWNV
jgi:hypothetical protein